MKSNNSKQTKAKKNDLDSYSNLDYPGINYPSAFFLILSSLLCIILLPKLIKNRFVFVIVSALIISFSFVFSNYKIGKNKRKLDKIFVIKLIISFIIVGFVFLLAFYKK